MFSSLMAFPPCEIAECTYIIETIRVARSSGCSSAMTCLQPRPCVLAIERRGYDAQRPPSVIPSVARDLVSTPTFEKEIPRLRLGMTVVTQSPGRQGIGLYRDKRQFALAQSPRAVRFDGDGVAGANRVAHEALSASGFQNEHMAFFDLLIFLREIFARAPEHRRVFARGRGRA